MLKKIIFALLSIALLNHAAFALSGDKQEVPAADKQTVLQLIAALKSEDKQSVAKLIQYPVNREQPLAPLQNEEELIEHFDEFFDAKTEQNIETAEIWYNWSGTTVIGSGLGWVENGKIKELNIATKHQDDLAEKARDEESLSLYPTARDYDSIAYECTTKNYHIRIQDPGYTLHVISDLPHGNTQLALAGNIYIDGSNRHYVTRSYAGQTYQGTLPSSANGETLDLTNLTSKLKQHKFKAQILESIAPIDAYDYLYPNKLQYFSWKTSQALSEKPELTLLGKIKIYKDDGFVTGGADFTFKHGSYTYIVTSPVLGDSYLIIKNGQDTILNEICYPRNIQFKW